jgi:protein SFI1
MKCSHVTARRLSSDASLLMFRPRRTSSPSRTVATSSHASAPSTSFISATPELASLAPDEVEFIDEVIAQAGPSASTFLSVLNAYNDVLRARGLDSRDEVVYYGKLLKLGTLKGRTWAEKWEVVRGVQEPVAGPSRPIRQAARVTSRLDGPIARRDPDTFTLHSHDNDEDDSQDTDTPRIGRRPLSPASELSNSLGLSTAPLDNTPVHFPSRARPTQALPTRRPQLWESISVTSDSEEHTGSPNATISAHPVSYRQNPPIAPRQRLTSDPKPTNTGNASRVVAPTASHRAVEKARESRSNTVNDEDAWAKIKYARDEEDADVFRREQLLVRCWNVWREGLDWITVSSRVRIGVCQTDCFFVDYPCTDRGSTRHSRSSSGRSAMARTDIRPTGPRGPCGHTG